MSDFVGTPPLLYCHFSLISNISIDIQEYNHKMICISDHGINCAMPYHLFGTKLVSLGQLADEIWVIL